MFNLGLGDVFNQACNSITGACNNMRRSFTDSFTILRNFNKEYPGAFFNHQPLPDLLPVAERDGWVEGVDNLCPRYTWAFGIFSPFAAVIKTCRLVTRAVGVSERGKATTVSTIFGLSHFLFDTETYYSVDEIATRNQIINDSWNWNRLRRSPLSMLADGFGAMLSGLFIIGSISAILMSPVKIFRLITRAIGFSKATASVVAYFYYYLTRQIFDHDTQQAENAQYLLIDGLLFDSDRWWRSPFSTLADFIGAVLSGVLIITVFFIASFCFIIKAITSLGRVLGISEVSGILLGSILDPIGRAMFTSEVPAANAAAQPQADFLTYLTYFENIFAPIRTNFANRWQGINGHHKERWTVICDAIGLVPSLCYAQLAIIFMQILKAVFLCFRAIGFSEAGFGTLKLFTLDALHFFFSYEDAHAATLAEIANRFSTARWGRSKFSFIADAIGVGVVAFATLIVLIPLVLIKVIRLMTRLVGFSKAGLYGIAHAFKFWSKHLFNFYTDNNDQDFAQFNQALNDECFSQERSQRFYIGVAFDKFGIWVTRIVASIIMAPFMLGFKILRLITRLAGFSLAAFYFASLISYWWSNFLFLKGGDAIANFKQALENSLSLDRAAHSPFSWAADWTGVVVFATVITVCFALFPMTVIKLPLIFTRAIGISEAGGIAAQGMLNGFLGKFFGNGHDLNIFQGSLNDCFTAQRREDEPLSYVLDKYFGIYLARGITFVFIVIPMTVFKIGRLLTRCFGVSLAAWATLKLFVMHPYIKLFKENNHASDYWDALKACFTNRWGFEGRSPVSSAADAIGAFVVGLVSILPALLLGFGKIILAGRRFLGISMAGLYGLVSTASWLWIQFFTGHDKADYSAQLTAYKQEQEAELFSQQRKTDFPVSTFFDRIGLCVTTVLTGLVLGPVFTIFKIALLLSRAFGFSAAAWNFINYLTFAFSHLLFNTTTEESAKCWNDFTARFSNERWERSGVSAFFDAAGLIPTSLAFGLVLAPLMIALKVFRLITRIAGISQANARFFLLTFDNILSLLTGKEPEHPQEAVIVGEEKGDNGVIQAADFENQPEQPAERGEPQIEGVQRPPAFNSFGEIFQYYFCERFLRSPFSTVADAIGSVVTGIIYTPIMAGIGLIAHLLGLNHLNLLRMSIELRQTYNMFVAREDRYPKAELDQDLHTLSQKEENTCWLNRWLSHINIPNIIFQSLRIAVYLTLVAFIALPLRLIYAIYRCVATLFCIPTHYHADYSNVHINVPLEEGNTNPLEQDGNGIDEITIVDEKLGTKKTLPSKLIDRKSEATDGDTITHDELVILRNSLDWSGRLTPDSYQEHLNRSRFERACHTVWFDFGKIMRLLTNSIAEDLINFLVKIIETNQREQPGLDANRYLFFQPPNENGRSNFQHAVTSFKEQYANKYEQKEMQDAVDIVTETLGSKYSYSS